MGGKDSSEKIKKRYDRIAPVYDLLEGIIEKIAFSRWRRKFWREIEKEAESGVRILEAGVGTGKNMPYYPSGAEITAIDFSPRMIDRAEKRKRKLESARDIDIELIDLRVMDIENLEFEGGSFDYIVTTCVFCSVPDPIRGLEELKRVLKPGGRIFMLEHMLSRKIFLKNLMDIFNFIPRYLWGANINRRTGENIRKAGLNVLEEEHIWLDIFRKFILTAEEVKQ